jgi:hypothetical protein
VKQLCPRGVQIRERAVASDHLFKSTLLHYFSESARTEHERLHLETLAAEKSDAEEALKRHKKLCPLCADDFELSAFHS